MTGRSKSAGGNLPATSRPEAANLTAHEQVGQDKKETLTERLNRRRDERLKKKLHDDEKIREEISHLAEQGKKLAQTLTGQSLVWLRDAFRLASSIETLSGHLKHEPLVPAPEEDRYENRENWRESAPDFIRRMYQSKLDGTFSRAALGTIDDSAVKGLRDWESRNGALTLEQLNLPTIDEVNTRKLEAVRLDEGLMEELARLASVQRTRQKRKNNLR